jgi:hypothetical protein
MVFYESQNDKESRSQFGVWDMSHVATAFWPSVTPSIHPVEVCHNNCHINAVLNLKYLEISIKQSITDTLLLRKCVIVPKYYFSKIINYGL